MLRNFKRSKDNSTLVKFANHQTPTDLSSCACGIDNIQQNIIETDINYFSDLKPIIQQLKVPQGSDGVVEFSAWCKQLEAYFAQLGVLKALFHAEKFGLICL